MNEQDWDKVFKELRERAAADEELKKDKNWINKVDPLLLDYEDYRKTKLWKSIKKRILERDQKQCGRCGGSAAVVHHISYDPPVMLGQDDSKLISLCNGCHSVVHFDKNGNVRGSEDQFSVLRDLSFNDPLPKIDMRYRLGKPPGWDRLTDRQQSEWRWQFNQKMIKKYGAKDT